MADTTEVRYTGPGSEADPRTMAVSLDEAKRLEATGLWSQKKTPAKPAVGAAATDEGCE